MKKQSQLIVERMRRVMQSQRISGLEPILTALRNDTESLLQHYMAVESGAVKLILDLESDGSYTFTLTAKTNRLIEPGKMIIDQGDRR